MWRHLANLLTLSVFVLGALVVADPRLAARSAGLVILAALLDGADGWVARRAGGPTRYGALLDLAADWTAFGLAPASLVLARFGVVGQYGSGEGFWWTEAGTCVVCVDALRGPIPLVAAAGLFLGAALFRLARQAFGTPSSRPGFTGMPMPADGLLVVAAAATSSDKVLAALALAAVSALAVSRWRYPALPWLWRHARKAVLVTVGIMIVIAPVSPFGALLAGTLAYSIAPLLVPVPA